MNLKELGYTTRLQEYRRANQLEDFQLGRVIAEHKERYVVQTSEKTFNAEITGNLRFSAQGREDFPAVGDWVALLTYDADAAIIHKILPRFSMLTRQAVGKYGEIQIIAANIDVAFIVQAVDRDFNLNRMERYLSLCNHSDIQPVILLSKTDLADKMQLEETIIKIQKRVKNTPVLPLSSETKDGYEQLEQFFEPFKTYCFLGSSGVGKSTVVNHLAGSEVLKTSAISSSTQKGRHTTSHRELIVLPNKSIVIDTPGMREIGLTDNADGIELTYDEISELAKQCRFNDCSHTSEKGCAVLRAVEDEMISEAMLENYKKLLREQLHFSSSVKEKRQKSKERGKMIKAILNEKKRDKFYD
ncbi:ribosome small subunit-dependent GTPase A [Maribellus maritimus]|uniref:ribosome small subunit-dependent GTPase A n=1 Tax=Maribellus maritimus TaxID=2870838 RepID=UPI001EEA7C45|nr:ribosome small subunit-dependent GTPase A [Maribellus maritimus]MCG6187857.1 ribosome small subunit-dependent GTPase A [Maribellus maritimus]